MDGFLLNHSALSEVRALLSACGSDMHTDQLGMLLDDWIANEENPVVWRTVKPFVGTHSASEQLDDMKFLATKECGDNPAPWGSEYEWSSAEGERVERWMEACQKAEVQATKEWRKLMGDMLRAVEGVLS